MAEKVLQAVCLFAVIFISTSTVKANWCVARSDASELSLETALNYACGSIADCIPLQANGLCFLPNTIQAHASYAFNSYFQRRAMAPGSCDFAGTATVAKTDPSYGSCVYPASASTAGGIATPSTTPIPGNPITVLTPPGTTQPTFRGSGSGSGSTSTGGGGLNPTIMSPALPNDADTSKAPAELMVTLHLLSFSLVLTILFLRVTRP